MHDHGDRRDYHGVYVSVVGGAVCFYMDTGKWTHVIERILTEPAVYRRITDDYSVPVEYFRLPQSGGFRYALAMVDTRAAGALVLAQRSGVCYEVHFAMLPEFWGEAARRVAEEAPGWIFRETPCRRLVAEIPACNPAAMRMARLAGMKECGRHAQAWQKWGRMHDVVVFGLSKEEVS